MFLFLFAWYISYFRELHVNLNTVIRASLVHDHFEIRLEGIKQWLHE